MKRTDFIHQLNDRESLTQKRHSLYQKTFEILRPLKSYGVHSANRMKSAGFKFTGVGDTARCEHCGLEVSNWTRKMDPFNIHRERNPNCQFITPVESKHNASSNSIESPIERQKLKVNDDLSNGLNISFELDILKQVRERTFSHCPKEMTQLKDQMIRAGFFKCNVTDRVMCIYCNLICQNWKEKEDDPIEIHKTLSPKCPYVLSMINQASILPTLIANETLTNISDDHADNAHPFHTNFASITSRISSFEACKRESLKSVDKLVKAGFFYNEIEDTVRCFHCDGSLENWSENVDPLIEHIKSSRICAYARQLCGQKVYNNIEKAKSNESAHTESQISINPNRNSSVGNHQQIQVIDEQLLSRLVAARLDLSISQRLLDQNFKSSVIKRCWEDQLRLKQDDFVTETDLYIACIILQKQITHINGRKDNIVVPSIAMKSIHERDKAVDTLVQDENMSFVAPIASTNTATMKNNDKLPPASLKKESYGIKDNDEMKTIKETTSESKLSINNPCILCIKEEKRLACIPCGHLAVCHNCGQTIRFCPVCSRSIEVFVRVYI